MDTERRMDGIPIVEAAAVLGTTPDALRKRVARGKVPGYKQDGQWYAVLPDSDSQSDRDDRQATVNADILSVPLVDSLREEVVYLRSQLTEKDKQLADRSREIQELHVILQTAQQNEQRLLNAGASVEMSKPSNAPERTREDESPPSDTKTPQRGVQREIEASPKQRWPWWMRILGGK